MRILPHLLFLSLVACPKGTPTQPVAEAEAEAAYTGALPVDPDVRQGTLDNGMKWYIEVNKEPANRAVFRLAVDAGSLQEDDDQRGLAHLLEHMAFNGSEHFEGNELIEYLESVGTRFGAHLNAHTSTDETVYKLSVPTDDPEIWDKAFLVFQDWAGGVTNSDQAIEDERGVVLEEWRSRRGAGARMRDAMRPLTYQGTKYIDRNTIGTEASLKTFTPDAVRRFYRDWYRPDLMAIIVVGDVDPDDVQARIEKHFSGLTMPDNPRERERPEIPPHDETLYFTMADPELTSTGVTITHKHDSPHENTHEAYRQGFVDSLISSMVNERFRDMAQDPQAPFLGAVARGGRLAPQEGMTMVAAGTPEGSVLDGLRAIATEMTRARRHGFTEGELQRAADKQLRSMKDYYDERDTTHSQRHADEIVRVFLTGESMPGIAYEWEMSQVFLEDITVAEVNARAATHWMAEDSRIISVTMPEKEGLALPTVEEIKAVMDEVAASDIAPPEDEAITGPLMAEKPAPGSVVAKEEVPELGAHRWTLSNGIVVWLRPTDFKADQITMRSFSPGGHGGIAQDRYVAASTATGLMQRSGIADYKAPKLAKFLAGKQASVSPWINTWFEGLNGSASPDDLELMFELAHLSLTQPRFDADAFEVYKRGQVEAVRNRLSNPGTLFGDKWNALMYQGHPRWAPWTDATIEALNLEASQAVFQDRFADTSDFTFVFVGNIDLDTIEPMLAQYIATLPTTEREDVQTDPQTTRATGVHTATVRAGLEPKATWRMEMHGEFEGSWQERTNLSALKEILSVRMRKKLREEMGGVYGVGVSTSTWTLPDQGYRLSVNFSCDPDRVEELSEAAWAILEDVRTQGVLASEVADVRAKYTRSMEEALETNGFYLGISNALRRGEDPRDMMDYRARIEALSAEVVNATAARYINPDQYVNVTLLPEAQATE